MFGPIIDKDLKIKIQMKKKQKNWQKLKQLINLDFLLIKKSK